MEDTELINRIFIHWNPIGVDAKSAESEYSAYAKEILSIKNDMSSMVKLLEKILLEDIGLDYDANNIEQKKDVVYFAYEFYKARNVD